MDYLERPDIKEKYEKCKYVVKLWEHNFKKKHGRQPSRLDIREADKSVRDAYRQYFKLKTTALEQSFQDVDGFHSDEEPPTEKPEPQAQLEPGPETPTLGNIDDTWGSHLNKQQSLEGETSKEKSQNLNSSFAKKIFCGAKFTKRNPRKSNSFSQKSSAQSMSFSQKLSESSTDCFQSLAETQLSSTSFSSEGLPTSFKDLFNNSTMKIINGPEKVMSQSTNLLQSVINDDYKISKSVDKGWMERVAQSAGISVEDNVEDGFNSDDIIDNSDDEGSALKKPKLDLPENYHNDEAQMPEPEVSPLKIVNEIRGKAEEPSKLKASQDFLKVFGSIPSLKLPIRRSSRSTKASKSLAESDSENEDPFKCDTDQDPDFRVGNSKKSVYDFPDDEMNEEKSVKEKTKKSKKRSRQKSEIIAEKSGDAETAGYELEYSIKPRVSKPRFRNLKKLIQMETDGDEKPTTEPEIKSKRQQLKEKLQKRIESGNLNDNFVSINLKKKIFVRGKKSQNYSKYKKQQWKNKKKSLLDMGGCDGGQLICFNCGQEGHFAQNCDKVKGDSLLPLAEEQSEVVEESPLSSLEEAAEMAKNIEGSQSSGSDELFDDVDNEDLLSATLKLEKESSKLDLNSYLDSAKIVEPYYDLTSDGNLIETPKEVYDALLKFGYSEFRPGQEKAIMRILSGKSTLVTLSTGSGKSLCYQLPAFLYSQSQNCITLVISPLVSLMEDQVTGIPGFLKAACLHTNKTDIQKQKILDSLKDGGLDVLLVSPEAVVAGERSTGFRSLLRHLPPIAFVCIDEAHCVSQWSHNFRPSYLMICRVLREKMGIKTILGLTATSTRVTTNSIIEHLQIQDGIDGLITDTPLPDNLTLTISKDKDRDLALLTLLNVNPFKEFQSIIIYCIRREECTRIATFLRTSLRSFFQQKSEMSNLSSGKGKRKRTQMNVEAYHAGLAASRRRTIQRAFMAGELRIVVATVAFGMGINKSDLRGVIHYNMPKNFESYVQEVGRSGRDGLPAHCHLFLDSNGNDEQELRRHIYANSIDRHVIRKLLQKVFLPCSCKEKCPRHEVAFSIEETVRNLDVPEENISTLLCYLELHQNHYIELLSVAYCKCKVISYGGRKVLEKAAKMCAPLAMAMALNKSKQESNIVEFAIIDIASAIGWDSGICKHKLKNLEWTTENGRYKRTTISVQFSELGFRLMAPGNLSDVALDEALDSLYEHVTAQEQTSLLQLHAISQTFMEVALDTFQLAFNTTNDDLKKRIRQYFQSVNPLDTISLSDGTSKALINESDIINNIRGLIATYRDNNFTGRAIARIFHGIQSPNYPAVVWGRCRYWRCGIKIDFHTICRLATKEILNFR